MKIIAGIDGGGTKTTVVCCNLKGQIVADHKFGPMNVNSIGEEGFTILMAQICEFLQNIGQCVALCIGAAGISNPIMQRLTKEAMEQAHIRNWKLVGDHEIALCGALEGAPGVAVVAGTGSICVGRNANGEYVRTGGWGHLIGDEGSGYAIGRDVLRLVTQEWDGYGDVSGLARTLAEKFGIDDREKMISYVYDNDKSNVARIARVAEQEAATGDHVAVDILTENARRLSVQVEAVTRRLHMNQGEVALLGGLLENDTMYRRLLRTAVEEQCPGFTCIAPRQNAAYGAVLLATQMSKDIHEEV